MADAEIDRIRALFAAAPRPADLTERRARLDGFGARYPIAADFTVAPVLAGGVAAEWTTAPGAGPARAIVSPLHADLRGLPPLLIQVGSAETLLDDAVRLAGAADRRVTLRSGRT